MRQCTQRIKPDGPHCGPLNRTNQPYFLMQREDKAVETETISRNAQQYVLFRWIGGPAPHGAGSLAHLPLGRFATSCHSYYVLVGTFPTLIRDCYPGVCTITISGTIFHSPAAHPLPTAIQREGRASPHIAESCWILLQRFGHAGCQVLGAFMSSAHPKYHTVIKRITERPPNIWES